MKNLNEKNYRKVFFVILALVVALVGWPKITELGKSSIRSLSLPAERIGSDVSLQASDTVNVIDGFGSRLKREKELSLELVQAQSELNRLRNSIAIQFQESMKGQVSDFEARMILNSFFNTLSLPEANEIAFANMKYINDLRRETIKIAERTNGFTQFEEEMAKWKKENRPDAIKSKDDKYDELRNKYGTILSE